eukprot:TRINITY_DN378_c0_g2_i1.p1 TRINITY_DN378_c0_g2~~TRINITY_DN378_c0_g2_i1.p1  ORF type:complete len:481 (+),score=182.68 TRINITY_DN378_c0_g2_i1:68-1510(+)
MAFYTSIKSQQLPKQATGKKEDDVETKRSTRVTRYRPGELPEWANDVDLDVEDQSSSTSTTPLATKKLSSRRPLHTAAIISMPKKTEVSTARKAVQAQIITSTSSSISSIASSSISETVVKKEEISKEQESTAAVSVEAAEDEDEVERRRERARLKALQKSQVKQEKEAEPQSTEESAEEILDEEGLPRKIKGEDEEGIPGQEEQMEEEDEVEEEEEEEEEEEKRSSRPLFKPVYVSKKERETVDERKRIEEEEKEIDMVKMQRDAERKEEAKQLLVAQVEKEDKEQEKLEKIAAGETSDTEMPDDQDQETDEVELEKWKQRELARIRNERMTKQKTDEERTDVERRRKMTDAEVQAENKAIGWTGKEKTRGGMRYLQKYFHPGSFYLDESDPIFKRDFNQPTGQDKTVDRMLLPTVLQVKKFGLKGRTKYTHLTDQDTTKRNENPWVATEAVVAQRRLAGTGTLDKFIKRKKEDKKPSS